MAFKMKGSPMQRNFGISPIKQDEKYTHKDMYDIEQEMSYIQEDLEDSDEYLTSQGLNRKELEKKLIKLTEQRDKIHSTLEGGNIKPGYDKEGKRDESKDEKYTE